MTTQDLQNSSPDKAVNRTPVKPTASSVHRFSLERRDVAKKEQHDKIREGYDQNMSWVEQKWDLWINEFTPPPPPDVPHVDFSKNYDNVDFTTGVEADSYYGLVCRHAHD